MSRKTCFMIFVIAVIALMISFMLKFSPVTTPATAIFNTMKSPYIAASAVILALLLNHQKQYWLIMFACALIAAIVIQLFVVGGSLALWPIVYKTAAFMVYVYLITLVRFMI